MIWLSLARAAPLPGWKPSDRLLGFVDLVPDADLSTLGSDPADPAGHPAHALGTTVRLVPEADADLDAALAVIQNDPRTTSATLVEGAIQLEHSSPLDVLTLGYGAATLGDAFVLEEAHASAAAVLAIENISSARAWVTVAGVRIGRIGPYTTAVVRDVPVGVYEVDFELPNGFVRRSRIRTVPDATPSMLKRMRD